MELLVLSSHENVVDESHLLSDLMLVATRLSKKLYFYPAHGARKQSEVSIGDFTESSDDLTFFLEPRDASGLPIFSVIDHGNDFFDLSKPDEEELLRLGIVRSEDVTLLDQFCREYLNVHPKHLLSIEGRVDKFFDPLVGLLSLTS